ncbi:MAG: cytidylate kinase-like family protein [Desulfobacteraceae bacterium]|nr:MAG: cytidylate kinase-like family protein [Desulfobacteraceae bacterium]
MGIITISRGSYSSGKEVAEKVAQFLQYDCISREVLLDASGRYHVDEIKLVRAIHDAPSILERLGRKKTVYVAFIRSALVSRVKKDNVVYHGLAGHLLLKGVPHVLKVRIIADLETRAKKEAEREGINMEKARAIITADDQERRKWTQSLYGADPWDSSLYDLVLKIDRLSFDDAVDLICRAACREAFKTTASSQQKLDDLDTACAVKAALIEEFPEVMVTCEYGNVVIYTTSGERHANKLRQAVKPLEETVEGINSMEVHSGSTAPLSAV